MKKIDYKTTKEEDLLSMIGEARETLKQNSFGSSGASASAPHHVKEAKRKIARILTELRSRN